MRRGGFGSKLLKIRKSKKIPLRELARRANVNHTYLSKVENGKKPPPSLPMMVRIASELDDDELRDYCLSALMSEMAVIQGMIIEMGGKCKQA